MQVQNDDSALACLGLCLFLHLTAVIFLSWSVSSGVYGGCLVIFSSSCPLFHRILSACAKGPLGATNCFCS